jgi:hypothetical protein
MINYILLGIFAALQIADLYSTVTALNTGKAYEANPVMAWFFKRIGTLPALLIIKAIVIGLIFYFVDSWMMLAVLNILYAYVVYLNVKTIQKLGKL